MTETYLTEGPSPSPQSGTVIAFVSPKGGTGKTVIAATTAYLLCKAGKRTIAIDSDFSTRGLSLYLLGSTDDIDPRDENCLAEIILREIPVEKVEPRQIMREGLMAQGPLHLILSNRDLWRGGRPDKDFTAGAIPVDYFQRFRALCLRLRQTYEYVIINSRGGYDLFSAVPAIVADRYVVVMEADKVSIDQVFGFQRSIQEFAGETETTARASGFIINKATFSPDDDTVPRGLQSLFDVRTLGVIPADNDCIRAYTNKELPSDKYPYSDFAYHVFRAIDRMINPTSNWDAKGIAEWRTMLDQVHRGWSGRMRLKMWQEFAVIGQSIVVLLTLAVAGVFLSTGGAVAETVTYIGAAIAAYWGLATSGLRVQQQLLSAGRERSVRRIFFAAGASLLALLPVLFILGGLKLWDRRMRLDEMTALVPKLTEDLNLSKVQVTELAQLRARLSNLRIEQHRFGVGQPNPGGGIEWLACGSNPSTRLNELCPDGREITVVRSLVPVSTAGGGECGFAQYVGTCVVY